MSTTLLPKAAFQNPILVPLDFPDLKAALEMAKVLGGSVGGYKIGLELFNAAGLPVFGALKEAHPETRLFYDAKLHDIPNTVAGAVRAAAQHGVWMINVHASGGGAMMRAAVDAAHEADRAPLVIAVTVLTSIDEQQLHRELGVPAALQDHVVSLAFLARQCGCDGVVASPQEIRAIKEACGPEFLVVTPGVRPTGSALADQKRITTPGQAIQDGADYLVIGRPITGAPDPAAAARDISIEIDAAR